jgi:hypothetical protein
MYENKVSASRLHFGNISNNLAYTKMKQFQWSYLETNKNTALEATSTITSLIIVLKVKQWHQIAACYDKTAKFSIKS